MNTKRNFDLELGLFLYRAIVKSDYTYETIAEALGVSREAVNQYCSGKRKPKQRTLLRLIKLTNVQVEDIQF